MPHSDTRLSELVKQSYTADIKCEILNSELAVLQELDIEDGQVSTDRDSDTRTTARFTLADPDLALSTADVDDLLHPLSGNYIRAYRQGVLLGTFVTGRYEVQESHDDFRIQLRAYDISHAVQRNKFSEHWEVDIGTPYTQAIKDIIKDVRPDARFIFPQLEYVTPRLHFGESESDSDRWGACLEMAESFGYHLYYNENGILVLKREPSIERATVEWTFEEGEYNILTEADKTVDDTDIYNVVVVIGENTDNDEPVVSIVKDENPSSPTYVNGPVGEIPYFLNSQYITSEDQAKELAEARLRQVAGVPEEISIECVPHPGLKADSVVEIKSSKAKIEGKYLVESSTLPLEYGRPMQLTMKSKRVENG